MFERGKLLFFHGGDKTQISLWLPAFPGMNERDKLSNSRVSEHSYEEVQ